MGGVWNRRARIVHNGGLDRHRSGIRSDASSERDKSAKVDRQRGLGLGRGLFTSAEATLTFKPAPVGHGIVFVRTDLRGRCGYRRWCSM